MIQKMRKREFDERIALVFSIVLAVVVFVGLYGIYPLDVCNDSWILLQYDGTDIMQHYAGWAQYRVSEWSYPLGYANKLAYGDGTYITYTDSVPYVAMLFKVFRNILPETFQYFGWFTLVCYILQSVGACMLLKRRVRTYTGLMLGEMFFLTAPVLIERTYKHTALSAQWLVLFAIYYYLKYRESEKDTRLPWELIVLATLTVGIHPYFLPMVMIFVLLVVIEAIVKKYAVWRIARYTILSLVFPIASGLIIGVIGTDVKNTRSGYGYFGMNLNALFNPQSASGYAWSQVLPERGQIYSTYEGFNYLGLGLLILVGICFLIFGVTVVKDKEYRRKIIGKLKYNIAFICAMTFMTLFAVTHIVTYDYSAIMTISLPPEWVELAGLFRASGRMFWPVYYCIILVAIYYLLDKYKGKLGLILLGGLLCIQIYDMWEVYQVRYERMCELYDKETIMDDEVLVNVADKEVLVIIGTENFEVERVLAVWAARHNMGVAYSIANSGEYKNAQLYTNWFEESMQQGIMRDDVMYVTFGEDVAEQWRTVLTDDIYNEYKRGFYYFFYKE